MKLYRTRGFTLLEIMVALAVVALAMGAVIKSAGDYAENQSYLRDRTLTLWVARNVLAQYQLEQQWPNVGMREGTQVMGRAEWEWQAKISQTEEPRLRRIDIEVRAPDTDEDASISGLSGFLMKPES